MTSTRDKAVKIFEHLIKDPYYQKSKGKTREEVVWTEAQQRARQAQNNEMALSMAVSDDESGAVKSLLDFMTKADDTPKPTKATPQTHISLSKQSQKAVHNSTALTSLQKMDYFFLVNQQHSTERSTEFRAIWDKLVQAAQEGADFPTKQGFEGHLPVAIKPTAPEPTERRTYRQPDEYAIGENETKFTWALEDEIKFQTELVGLPPQERAAKKETQEEAWLQNFGGLQTDEKTGDLVKPQGYIHFRRSMEKQRKDYSDAQMKQQIGAGRVPASDVSANRGLRHKERPISLSDLREQNKTMAVSGEAQTMNESVGEVPGEFFVREPEISRTPSTKTGKMIGINSLGPVPAGQIVPTDDTEEEIVEYGEDEDAQAMKSGRLPGTYITNIFDQNDEPAIYRDKEGNPITLFDGENNLPVRVSMHIPMIHELHTSGHKRIDTDSHIRKYRYDLSEVRNDLERWLQPFEKEARGEYKKGGEMLEGGDRLQMEPGIYAPPMKLHAMDKDIGRPERTSFQDYEDDIRNRPIISRTRVPELLDVINEAAKKYNTLVTPLYKKSPNMKIEETGKALTEALNTYQEAVNELRHEYNAHESIDANAADASYVRKQGLTPEQSVSLMRLWFLEHLAKSQQMTDVAPFSDFLSRFRFNANEYELDKDGLVNGEEPDENQQADWKRVLDNDRDYSKSTHWGNVDGITELIRRVESETGEFIKQRIQESTIRDGEDKITGYTNISPLLDRHLRVGHHIGDSSIAGWNPEEVTMTQYPKVYAGDTPMSPWFDKVSNAFETSMAGVEKQATIRRRRKGAARRTKDKNDVIAARLSQIFNYVDKVETNNPDKENIRATTPAVAAIEYIWHLRNEGDTEILEELNKHAYNPDGFAYDETTTLQDRIEDELTRRIDAMKDWKPEGAEFETQSKLWHYKSDDALRHPLYDLEENVPSDRNEGSRVSLAKVLNGEGSTLLPRNIESFRYQFKEDSPHENGHQKLKNRLDKIRSSAKYKEWDKRFTELEKLMNMSKVLNEGEPPVKSLPELVADAPISEMLDKLAEKNRIYKANHQEKADARRTAVSLVQDAQSALETHEANEPEEKQNPTPADKSQMTKYQNERKRLKDVLDEAKKNRALANAEFNDITGLSRPLESVVNFLNDIQSEMKYGSAFSFPKMERTESDVVGGGKWVKRREEHRVHFDADKFKTLDDLYTHWWEPIHNALNEEHPDSVLARLNDIYDFATEWGETFVSLAPPPPPTPVKSTSGEGDNFDDEAKDTPTTADGDSPDDAKTKDDLERVKVSKKQLAANQLAFLEQVKDDEDLAFLAGVSSTGDALNRPRAFATLPNGEVKYIPTNFTKDQTSTVLDKLEVLIDDVLRASGDEGIVDIDWTGDAEGIKFREKSVKPLTKRTWKKALMEAVTPDDDHRDRIFQEGGQPDWADYTEDYIDTLIEEGDDEVWSDENTEEWKRLDARAKSSLVEYLVPLEEKIPNSRYTYNDLINHMIEVRKDSPENSPTKFIQEVCLPLLAEADAGITGKYKLLDGTYTDTHEPMPPTNSADENYDAKKLKDWEARWGASREERQAILEGYQISMWPSESPAYKFLSEARKYNMMDDYTLRDVDSIAHLIGPWLEHLRDKREEGFIERYAIRNDAGEKVLDNNGNPQIDSEGYLYDIPPHYEGREKIWEGWKHFGYEDEKNYSGLDKYLTDESETGGRAILRTLIDNLRPQFIKGRDNPQKLEEQLENFVERVTKDLLSPHDIDEEDKFPHDILGEGGVLPNNVKNYIVNVMNDDEVGLSLLGHIQPELNHLLYSNGLPYHPDTKQRMTPDEFLTDPDSQLPFDLWKAIFGQDIFNTWAGHKKLEDFLHEVDNEIRVYRSANPKQFNLGVTGVKKGNYHKIFHNDNVGYGKRVGINHRIFGELATRVLGLPQSLEEWNNPAEMKLSEEVEKSLADAGYTRDLISKLIMIAGDYATDEFTGLVTNTRQLSQKDMLLSNQYRLKQLLFKTAFDRLDDVSTLGTGAEFDADDPVRGFSDRLKEEFNRRLLDHRYNGDIGGPFKRGTVSHMDDYVSKLISTLDDEINMIPRTSKFHALVEEKTLRDAGPLVRARNILQTVYTGQIPLNKITEYLVQDAGLGAATGERKARNIDAAKKLGDSFTNLFMLSADPELSEQHRKAQQAVYDDHNNSIPSLSLRHAYHKTYWGLQMDNTEFDEETRVSTAERWSPFSISYSNSIKFNTLASLQDAVLARGYGNQMHFEELKPAVRKQITELRGHMDEFKELLNSPDSNYLEHVGSFLNGLSQTPLFQRVDRLASDDASGLSLDTIWNNFEGSFPDKTFLNPDTSIPQHLINYLKSDVELDDNGDIVYGDVDPNTGEAEPISKTKHLPDNATGDPRDIANYLGGQYYIAGKDKKGNDIIKLRRDKEPDEEWANDVKLDEHTKKWLASGWWHDIDLPLDTLKNRLEMMNEDKAELDADYNRKVRWEQERKKYADDYAATMRRATANPDTSRENNLADERAGLSDQDKEELSSKLPSDSIPNDKVYSSLSHAQNDLENHIRRGSSTVHHPRSEENPEGYDVNTKPYITNTAHKYLTNEGLITGPYKEGSAVGWDWTDAGAKLFHQLPRLHKPDSNWGIEEGGFLPQPYLYKVADTYNHNPNFGVSTVTPDSPSDEGTPNVGPVNKMFLGNTFLDKMAKGNKTGDLLKRHLYPDTDAHNALYQVLHERGEDEQVSPIYTAYKTYFDDPDGVLGIGTFTGRHQKEMTKSQFIAWARHHGMPISKNSRGTEFVNLPFDESSDSLKRINLADFGARAFLPLSVYAIPPEDEGGEGTIGFSSEGGSTNAWNKALAHLRAAEAKYNAALNSDTITPALRELLLHKSSVNSAWAAYFQAHFNEGQNRIDELINTEGNEFLPDLFEISPTDDQKVPFINKELTNEESNLNSLRHRFVEWLDELGYHTDEGHLQRSTKNRETGEREWPDMFFWPKQGVKDGQEFDETDEEWNQRLDMIGGSHQLQWDKLVDHMKGLNADPSKKNAQKGLSGLPLYEEGKGFQLKRLQKRAGAHQQIVQDIHRTLRDLHGIEHPEGQGWPERQADPDPQTDSDTQLDPNPQQQTSPLPRREKVLDDGKQTEMDLFPEEREEPPVTSTGYTELPDKVETMGGLLSTPSEADVTARAAEAEATKAAEDAKGSQLEFRDQKILEHLEARGFGKDDAQKYLEVLTPAEKTATFKEHFDEKKKAAQEVVAPMEPEQRQQYEREIREHSQEMHGQDVHGESKFSGMDDKKLTDAFNESHKLVSTHRATKAKEQKENHANDIVTRVRPLSDDASPDMITDRARTLMSEYLHHRHIYSKEALKHWQEQMQDMQAKATQSGIDWEQPISDELDEFDGKEGRAMFGSEEHRQEILQRQLQQTQGQMAQQEQQEQQVAQQAAAQPPPPPAPKQPASAIDRFMQRREGQEVTSYNPWEQMSDVESTKQQIYQGADKLKLPGASKLARWATGVSPIDEYWNEQVKRYDKENKKNDIYQKLRSAYYGVDYTNAPDDAQKRNPLAPPAEKFYGLDAEAQKRTAFENQPQPQSQPPASGGAVSELNDWLTRKPWLETN